MAVSKTGSKARGLGKGLGNLIPGDGEIKKAEPKVIEVEKVVEKIVEKPVDSVLKIPAIDYNAVNNEIKEFRQSSLNFLKNNL